MFSFPISDPLPPFPSLLHRDDKSDFGPVCWESRSDDLTRVCVVGVCSRGTGVEGSLEPPPVVSSTVQRETRQLRPSLHTERLDGQGVFGVGLSTWFIFFSGGRWSPVEDLDSQGNPLQTVQEKGRLK